MNDDVCEVIITAPDAEWLATFTRDLVDNRLAACGHNIGTIRSIYRWDGAVHDSTEARVALHTRRNLIDTITKRTQQQHPYDVPCVIAVPIVGGNTDYIAWVLDSTRTAPDL